MKTNVINLCGAFSISVALFSGQTLLAGESVNFATAFSGVSVFDVPAKAVNLIINSPEGDRQMATENVVTAAVRLQPACAAAIVTAVSRANPSTASAAVLAAVASQHNQLNLIVRAATTAVPEQAAAIVATLIRRFPADYGAVATAASEAANDQSRSILAAVADNMPTLQGPINIAVSAYAAADDSLPVQAILIQSYNSALHSGAISSPRTDESSTTTATEGTMGQNSYTSSSNPGSIGVSTPRAGSTSSGVTPLYAVSPVSGGASAASAPVSAGLLPVTSGTVVAPPTVGPPFALYPNPITTIGPGQTVQQSPGGSPYGSP